MTDLHARLAPVVAAVALAVPLVGCTVTYVPADDASDVTVRAAEESDRSARVINAHLDLRAPPGSRVVRVENDGRDSEGMIETERSLRSLFTDLDAQLRRAGWNRGESEIESDELEVEYRRGGDELEIELEREGAGRYEFEVELD